MCFDFYVRFNIQLGKVKRPLSQVFLIYIAGGPFKCLLDSTFSFFFEMLIDHLNQIIFYEGDYKNHCCN